MHRLRYGVEAYDEEFPELVANQATSVRKNDKKVDVPPRLLMVLSAHTLVKFHLLRPCLQSRFLLLKVEALLAMKIGSGSCSVEHCCPDVTAIC